MLLCCALSLESMCCACAVSSGRCRTSSWSDCHVQQNGCLLSPLCRHPSKWLFIGLPAGKGICTLAISLVGLP